MPKQLNVNLNFNADTSQARDKIAELQRILQNFASTTSVSPKINIQQFQEASKAARELEQHLKAATDVNTGKLNLSAFSASLKSAGRDLDFYKNKMESVGPAGEMAFLKVRESIAMADAPLRKTSKLLTEFSTTLKNTARWQISSSILHGFLGTIQSAYGYAQDLNDSLNKIRIVTGQSTDEMAKFANNANKSAKALSTSTRAYSDAALIFYQQGLGNKEVEERTNTVIKMSNVTGDAAADVSSYMTAIWNNFDDGSESLEHYADVITALGASTASSSAEIAAGLEKFASVADTIGLSYDYSTSALATIVANTRQSAETVGTGLRTIFSRLQGLSLGETLDDGTDLNKYSKALKTVGVDILDVSGNMKSMDAILEDLASRWNILSGAQKTALAQTVGGVRQYTNLIALMDNWGDMQKNLLTAQGAEGSLQEQADIYAESWEASSKRVRAALENIYTNLIDDKFFIKLNNGFAVMLDGVNGFIKGFGGIKGIMMTVGSFITQKLAKEAPAALNTIKQNLLQITGAAKTLAVQEKESNLKALQAEAKGARENFNDGQGNLAYAVQTQFVEMLAKKKLELIQYEKDYSEAEKASAQAEIDFLERQKELMMEKGKQYDELYAKTTQLTNEINEAGVDFTTTFNGKSVDMSDLVIDIKDVVDQLSNLRVAKSNFDDLDKSIEDTDVDVKSLANGYFNLAKTMAIASPKGQRGEWIRLAKSIREAGKNSDLTREELVKIIKDSDAFKNVKTNISNAEAEITKMKNSMKECDEVNPAKIDAFVQALERMGIIGAESKVSLDNTRNSMRELKTHASTGMEAIMSFSGALMQMNAWMNSMKGIKDVFTNEDSTVVEKIGAAIGGLSATLMLYNSITKATTTLMALETAAHEKSTIALFLNAAAGDINATTKLRESKARSSNVLAIITETVAHWKLNAAMTPVLIVTLALLAATAALTATIWLIVKAFKAWQASTPEGKLKAAKEEAKKAAETFDAMKDRVEETHTALDKLKDAQETLKNLTVGTDEWRDAMIRVNEQVMNLIDKFPELIDMMESSNGSYTLTEEGFVYAQGQLRRMEQAAYNYKLDKRKDVLNQEIDNNKEKIRHPFTNLYGNSIFHSTDEYGNGSYDADAFIQTLQSAYNQVGEGILDRNTSDELFKALWNDNSEEYKQTYARINGKNAEDYSIYNEDNFEEFNKYLKDNVELLKANRLKMQEINKIDTMQLNNALQSLGNSRTTEQVKELGIDNYSTFSDNSKGKIETAFGNWNDHINYDMNDDTEKVRMIKDFMKLQGENVEYVAQQSGNMVLKIGDEVKKFTKDQVYDQLAEYYAADDFQTQLTEALQENIGKALGGVDLSNVDLDALNILDSFKLGLEKAAENSNFNSDKIFQSLFNLSGGTAEGLSNLINDQFKYLNFNDTQVLEKISDVSEKFDRGAISLAEYTDALSILNAEAQILAMGSYFADAADKLGLDEEDAAFIQEYAKSLMDMSRESDLLADSLLADADSAADLAVEITRMNKGIDDLADGFEDWKDILKSSAKESIEYVKAMSGMKKSLADILDVEADMISSDFVRDHMEDIEKAATGDEEAIDSLRDAMDEEIILQLSLGQTSEFVTLLDELDTKVQDLANNLPDIKVGAILDDDDFLAAADDLITQSHMTADQANAYFSGIGYEPVYSVEEVESKGALGTNSRTTSYLDNFSLFNGTEKLDLGPFGTYDLPIIDPKISWHTETEPLTPTEISTTIPLTSFSGDDTPPKIKGLRKKATGSMSNYSSNNAGGKAPGSSSSKKSGSGGSKAKTKKTSDEIDRFHVVKNQIEDLEAQIDKLSKAKDRAFGPEKLKLMDAEIAKTEQLKEKNKEYLSQVLGYINRNKQALIEYGAVFDKNGTILNYEDLMTAQINKFNAAADSDEASEAYDKFKKILEEYESDQDTFKSLEQTIIDQQNEIYDKMLEKVQYSVEWKISIEDRELKYLEYMLDRIEDKAFHAAEAIANIGLQTEHLFNKSGANKSGILGLLQNHGYSAQDAQGILSQMESGTLDNNALKETLQLTQGELDTLDGWVDDLMSINQQLYEMRDKVWEELNKEFEEYNTKMEDGISKMEHLKSVTQSYQNIIGIVGKKTLGITNDLINYLNNTIAQQSRNILAGNKAELDAIKKAREDLAATFNENWTEEDKNKWQEQMDTIENKYREVESSFMSSWEEALQSAADAWKASVDNIIEDFSKKLAGTAGSLAHLREQYDRTVEIDDRYLDDYEKIYRLTKLTREVGKAIDSTDNLNAKKELRELQEEILAMQEEGKEISQYDLDYEIKKFELKQAQLALDEAQNAKSNVKMVRGDDGTYGYVYTADENAVENAEQNYEDKLYEMQKLNADYIKSLQDNIIKAEEECMAAIQELNIADFANYEEYQARVDEITAYYQGKMGYYSSEMDKVLSNNKKLYVEDWQAYHEATGYKISEDQNYIDSFNETALSTLTGFQTMEEYQRAFNQTIGSPDDPNSLLGQLTNNYNEWKESVDLAMEAAGTSTENFRNKLDTEVNGPDGIIDKTEEAKRAVEDMSRDMQQEFADSIRATGQWATNYGTQIDNIITANERLIASYNVLRVAAASVGMASIGNIEATTPGSGIGAGDSDGSEGLDNGDPVDKTPYVIIADRSDGGKSRMYGFSSDKSFNECQNKLMTDAAGMEASGDHNPRIEKKSKALAMGYDTGGYTGDWTGKGKLAFLHQKEMVLNSEDTSNMLSIVDMVRQIAKVIDLNAAAASGMYSSMSSAYRVAGNNGAVQQEVTVYADFPGITSADGLEDAFKNIASDALHYINRNF